MSTAAPASPRSIHSPPATRERETLLTTALYVSPMERDGASRCFKQVKARGDLAKGGMVQQGHTGSQVQVWAPTCMQDTVIQGVTRLPRNAPGCPWSPC